PVVRMEQVPRDGVDPGLSLRHGRAGAQSVPPLIRDGPALRPKVARDLDVNGATRQKDEHTTGMPIVELEVLLVGRCAAGHGRLLGRWPADSVTARTALAWLDPSNVRPQTGFRLDSNMLNIRSLDERSVICASTRCN